MSLTTFYTLQILCSEKVQFFLTRTEETTMFIMTTVRRSV